jgi:hypothetical protein
MAIRFRYAYRAQRAKDERVSRFFHPSTRRVRHASYVYITVLSPAHSLLTRCAVLVQQPCTTRSIVCACGARYKQSRNPHITRSSKELETRIQREYPISDRPGPTPLAVSHAPCSSPPRPPKLPQRDQTWRLIDPGQRTCERRLYRAALSWLTINLSLYLDRAALHFHLFWPIHLTLCDIQKSYCKASHIGTIR